jgi:anti-sigma factor RsiW
VRCSSYESRFSDYIDGTLSPRKRAALRRHLDTCHACNTLISELRSVDALLLAPRELKPTPGFTEAAMSEVRSLPAPMIARRDIAPTLIAYLVFSWCVIAIWLAIDGPIARNTIRLAMSSWIGATTSVGTVASVVSHIFGGTGSGVAAFSALVIALDAALAIVFYGVIAFVYPRLVAKLSTQLASSSDRP